MRNDYEPFDNAEQVWFWFCGCLIARGSGLRSCNDYEGKPRNCEVADIYRIVKKMRLNRQITNRHLRTIMKWGNKEYPPHYDSRAKRSEIRLWDEAMRIFEFYLREKGIVQ